MVDGQKNRHDRSRVNVHEDDELRYWTQYWGISREQLISAVEKAGTSADNVARELGKVPP